MSNPDDKIEFHIDTAQYAQPVNSWDSGAATEDNAQYRAMGEEKRYRGEGEYTGFDAQEVMRDFGNELKILQSHPAIPEGQKVVLAELGNAMLNRIDRDFRDHLYADALNAAQHSKNKAAGLTADEIYTKSILTADQSVSNPAMRFGFAAGQQNVLAKLDIAALESEGHDIALYRQVSQTIADLDRFLEKHQNIRGIGHNVRRSQTVVPDNLKEENIQEVLVQNKVKQHQEDIAWLENYQGRDGVINYLEELAQRSSGLNTSHLPPAMRSANLNPEFRAASDPITIRNYALTKIAALNPDTQEPDREIFIGPYGAIQLGQWAYDEIYESLNLETIMKTEDEILSEDLAKLKQERQVLAEVSSLVYQNVEEYEREALMRVVNAYDRELKGDYITLADENEITVAFYDQIELFGEQLAAIDGFTPGSEETQHRYAQGKTGV